MPPGREPWRPQSEEVLSSPGRDPDRNLGAVTPVSGGLLRAVNSFRPKDHERAGAGAGSRTYYDGGGRAGHTRGARVSVPGAVFPPPNVSFSSAWLLQSPPRRSTLGLGSSVQASFSASLPPAPTELRGRWERNPFAGLGVEYGRRAEARGLLFQTPRLRNSAAGTGGNGAEQPS